MQNGMELIDEGHYASQQIGACIDRLANSWQALLEKYFDIIMSHCSTCV